MALESADFIDELDDTYPLGTDNVSQGDDHLRLIKHVLKTQFPNLSEAVTASADDLNGGNIPTGSISLFGGSSAPAGYLMCNGNTLSRTTYSDLYLVIGTTYGAGDGSTTFNLPDLRNRVPGGASNNALGAVAGKDDHMAADMPRHTHTMQSNGAHVHQSQLHGSSAYNNTAPYSEALQRDTPANYTPDTSSAGAHTHIIDNAGDNFTADNRQATLYVSYMIKT